MAKELFKAEVDEAAGMMRRAQRVMDLMDEAKGEATCTQVIELLDKAHRELCLVITFLNGGHVDRNTHPRETDADFSAQRKAFGRDGNFLKAGGQVKFSDPGTYRRKRRCAE